jgi:hypothetical protein
MTVSSTFSFALISFPSYQLILLNALEALGPILFILFYKLGALCPILFTLFYKLGALGPNLFTLFYKLGALSPILFYSINCVLWVSFFYFIL